MIEVPDDGLGMRRIADGLMGLGRLPQLQERRLLLSSISKYSNSRRTNVTQPREGFPQPRVLLERLLILLDRDLRHLALSGEVGAEQTRRCSRRDGR